MNEIKLKILAKDILEDTYFTPEKCPITKALHRAGHTNLEDIGEIRVRSGSLCGTCVIDGNNESYMALVKKIFGMYNSLKNNNYSLNGQIIKSILLKDFTHTLRY